MRLRFHAPSARAVHGRCWLVRRVAVPLLLAGAALPGAAPARALERLVVQLPLLRTSFSIRVNDLASQRGVLSGSSDLAQLDQASNGELLSNIRRLLATPLPIQTRDVLNHAIGTPLFSQLLLLASALIQVEGLPPDSAGTVLAAALRDLPPDQPLTILSLLQALPGQVASIDLEQALLVINRLQQQQRRGMALVDQLPAVSIDPALSTDPWLPISSRTLRLPVRHRATSLQFELVAPSQGANGRLVVISHGLWDGPVSFEGWADRLAGRGYTVILPHHPGSDRQQQQAMLSGRAAPPSPDELRLRPLDITALIDAVAAGAISGLRGVRTERVVVLGHSWGATTALQLAGARPGSLRLRQRCDDLNDPDRNLSWVLQCSFLSSAAAADLADRRVIGVAAVSPPLNLIVDTGAAAGIQARALLVSGSIDWVVPSGPEAIDRFVHPGRQGHQLVLVRGGDHFNLRAPRSAAAAPLTALMLAWTEAVFQAGAAARPAPGAAPLLAPVGWGNASLPLVEASRSMN
jgi:predicted dienelactone hydrolase